MVAASGRGSLLLIAASSMSPKIAAKASLDNLVWTHVGIQG